jgi:outer membrane receptor for ferrienterochelin and colicin
MNVVTGISVNNINGIARRKINHEIVNSMPWYNQMQYTFYAETDWQVYNFLKVTGGFQINKHGENVPVKFVPRAGFIINPAKKINIKALYAEAYRSPSAAEKTAFDSRRRGNPNLKPESVHSFDVELQYLGTQLQPALTFFTYNQTNTIVLSNSDPQQFVNEGEYSATGAEFEIKYVPKTNLYFTGSFSYQTNTLNNSVKNTSTGAVTAKTGVSYKFQSGFSCGIFNVFNSAPPDVIWNFPERQIVNSVPKAFNLLSVNLDYKIPGVFRKNTSALYLNVRAENLLNEEIYSPEWVRSRINSIPGKPGRRVFIGAKINL